MDELHEQTVNLLAFQELPKNVFDVQVAFNMVAGYGPRSNFSLQGVAQRIRNHYRHIARGAPEPALQVLQAPVFHGHGFSVYLEMDSPVSIADLAQALAGEHVVVSSSTVSPSQDSRVSNSPIGNSPIHDSPGKDSPSNDLPTNVSAAGQEDILVSLSNDPNHKHGVWLWATTDNLRIAALTAVECAETMTASRPKGQIQ
jgi:aspartate-semialdehyde dehydrogenase